jgi:6-phosphofructokinase 1
VLGLSRARREAKAVVDPLARERIDVLFCICIGGDGTLKGPHAIAEEIAQRG